MYKIIFSIVVAINLIMTVTGSYAATVNSNNANANINKSDVDQIQSKSNATGAKIIQGNNKPAGKINNNINAWCEEDCGKQITPGKKGTQIQK